MELVEQEGQFVVHHSKLIDYGVMTSAQSADVKKKLILLGMVEGEDFNLRHVSEVRKGRGAVVVNHYILTPESFKFCLARVQRRPDQPVDPVIYFRYFLLLEKMVKLYSMYETTKKDAEIASRDQRIADMFASMQLRDEEFKQDMKRRDDEAKQERAQIINKVDEVTEMLEDAKEDAEIIKEKLDEANEKLDVAEFARHEAEKARDAEVEARVRQMVVAGALTEDPSLRHVGCIVTRRNTEGELEVNFIGRQLKSFAKAMKDLEKLGYTQATGIFFTVDPIALRGATADKNKEDVSSMVGYVGKTLKNITNRLLISLGLKNGGVIVPRIGKQKSYIPSGSSFNLDMFLKNVEMMLQQTIGMDLATAEAKANHELELMQGRVYDADADAL